MIPRSKSVLKHTLSSLLACGSVAAASPALADQPARILEIDRFVGQIEMRTTPGAALNVQIQPGRKQTARQSQDNITLRVQGEFGNMRNTSCNVRNGKMVLRINGETYEEGDLPTLIVTGPTTVGLRIKKSDVTGRIGDVGGATLNLPGCGNLSIGNVRQDLEVNLVGSGNLEAGSIGRNTDMNLAGSGNIKTGIVRGKADINLAGSGTITLASAASVEASVAGSGDIIIAGGRGTLKASIAGSGDIVHNGTAINPEVSILGSGDVTVKNTEGQMRRTSMP
jgi:Putative auto-transporter adhesin, head GIN domain